MLDALPIICGEKRAESSLIAFHTNASQVTDPGGIWGLERPGVEVHLPVVMSKRGNATNTSHVTSSHVTLCRASQGTVLASVKEEHEVMLMKLHATAALQERSHHFLAVLFAKGSWSQVRRGYAFT